MTKLVLSLSKDPRDEITRRHEIDGISSRSSRRRDENGTLITIYFFTSRASRGPERSRAQTAYASLAQTNLMKQFTSLLISTLFVVEIARTDTLNLAEQQEEGRE